MNNEKIDLSNEQLDQWIKDACLKALGYLKVSNEGGKYALVEKGIYTVVDRGHTVLQKKTRHVTYNIFSKLIHRYLNFERQGYYYYYSRGSWRRHKQNTVT